ncbi:chondroitin AC/alginate lyase [Dacryopinax primogenitus]|uniref:Chondroitin AC/alginate lyase n=1 Tax=Dacryopinax primogenitus (strain DJM 731) TaxID=1858805 RepID=M5FVL5_DACPD|nr:chondroitin AC/alginate lyase [Dacryopinax primogenitus]EJU01866.1 chondroitin AC/alginate lyase [Dacryopinax primogenitus]
MLNMWTALGTTALLISASLADPTDWVNPKYIANKPDPSTSDARNAIIQGASYSSNSGPWTLTDTKILPPSGNSRDYLSWAPYHWPDCNWCPSKSKKRRLEEVVWLDAVNPGTRATTGQDSDHLYPRADISVFGPDGIEIGLGNDANTPSTPITSLPDLATPSDQVSSTSLVAQPTIGSVVTQAPPSLSLVSTALTSNPTSSDSVYLTDSSGNGQNAELYASTSSGSCTPSPTKSLAPSATWTTCPYKTKDGQVNPDVRQLNGVNAIQAVAQAVLYNAITFVLAGGSQYTRSATSIINTFFLDSKTGMNPNLNYGQLVRGPGHQQGQFMGVLDFRGMVKIVNGILMLRSTKNSDWTSSIDSAMTTWTKSYLQWIQTSNIGVAASKATNNHGTFWHAQAAALQILVGDEVGARQTIKNFFTGAFQDQIAASGEQPWEAARKGRSFHYRAFNLEALFTIGKLADQLGLNVWVLKTKSGATIQDAVDYTMTVPPDANDDTAELAPHVAAASAVYGDPKGTYAKFLARVDSSYKQQSYWYYDQPSAFTYSSAVKTSRRRFLPRDDFEAYDLASIYPSCLTVDNGTRSCTDPASPADVTDYYKPEVFYSVDLVQLDDAVFVSWDDIRQYY